MPASGSPPGQWLPPVQQGQLERQNEDLQQRPLELDKARATYFDLYDLAPVGYCILSRDGRIRQANRTACELLGIGDLPGRRLQQFIVERDHGILHDHVQRIVATREPHSCDLRMVRRNRRPFWARLSSAVAHDEETGPLCRTVMTDVTESKNAELALRKQKEFFLQIAENLSDFIAVLDLKGRRIYNSPSYQRFFGAGRDLRNTDSFADVPPDDRERVKRVFRHTVRTGEGHLIEYRLVVTDGTVRDMESRGSLIRDTDGRSERVLVVAHDITERKQLQEQVRQMAFHDALTGLPNRRLFSDRLNQAMAAGTRSACFGALIFIDLDNFKPLNDAYGHDLGDQLLIDVAKRLRNCVREVDTVARFGGDEFVVMLGQLDQDATESRNRAGIIAEKLRVALSMPFLLPHLHDKVSGAIEHCCAASIGVALFSDHESSPAELLKRADSAMYVAKQAGGNQVCFCDVGLR